MVYTNNFTEVKKYQGSSLRSHLRSFALDMLSVRNHISDTKKWYLRPRIQFLFIHHIFDDEVDTFEAVLEELSKHHAFISHSEAVKRILTGNIDRPYISWSSDDGFKNNVRAARILNQYGAKACFFLNPDSIGSDNKEWVSDFCGKRLKMPAIEFMNWEEVGELQKLGHEIGSHTMGHRNISQMTFEEVRQDLSSSKEILESHCGEIKHFAYPYGRFFDFNKMAFDLVFEAGYESCSAGERGCHISNGSKMRKSDLFIRRDHVICGWKLPHILYFVLNGAKKANLDTNFIPENW